MKFKVFNKLTKKYLEEFEKEFNKTKEEDNSGLDAIERILYKLSKRGMKDISVLLILGKMQSHP